MIRLPSPAAARLMPPLAVLLVALAGPALAQGTDEQREACTPDALKLCSDTIPDIAKTTACMKAHEAALSPRCRAVFNEPATSAPTIATADAKGKALKVARRKREKHEADASVAREEPALRHHRRQPPREDALDAPARLDEDRDRGTDEMDAAHGGPIGDAYGPDIRHFPPGEGPDEVPPYGGDAYDGGPREAPRYSGPGAWGGPRFADGGPDGFDGPGPERFGRGSFGPPPSGRDSRAAEDGMPRHGRHSAAAVIAHLCDAGEIDPRTCAETERALHRRNKD